MHAHYTVANFSVVSNSAHCSACIIVVFTYIDAATFIRFLVSSINNAAFTLRQGLFQYHISPIADNNYNKSFLDITCV